MIALLIQLLMIITPAISAVTLGLKYDELKRAGASKEWPAVKAAVTNSTIVDTGKKQKGQNLYQPEISLSYSVEGKNYMVKQRPSATNGQREGTKQWAREVALQYKPDTAVRLYYNPQRPQQATVLPGQTTVNKNQWLVIGGVMLLFSFILCVLGVIAITQNYLAVSTAVSFILGIVAFGMMLMLGFLLYLLAQEFRPK
ncbi:MAG TPA: DUF3592 domain-containing protein [Chloroflexota bacterium]|nr:DUF3592 domain-containing protein [Chloroflexota bacterium]